MHAKLPPVLGIGMVKGMAFREPRGIFGATLRDIVGVDLVPRDGFLIENDGI